MLSRMWAKIRFPVHRRRPVLQPAANMTVAAEKEEYSFKSVG
jgi:hypothetical protein